MHLNVLIVFTPKHTLLHKTRRCREDILYLYVGVLNGIFTDKMFHRRINNRVINYKKQSSFDGKITEKVLFQSVYTSKLLFSWSYEDVNQYFTCHYKFKSQQKHCSGIYEHLSTKMLYEKVSHMHVC